MRLQTNVQRGPPVWALWAPPAGAELCVRQVLETCGGVQADLKVQLKTWEPLLYEQNAAALLLQNDTWRQHTVFEAEACLACDWVHGTQGRTPFVKAFSECDFCSGVRNTREVRAVPEQVS